MTGSANASAAAAARVFTTGEAPPDSDTVDTTPTRVAGLTDVDVVNIAAGDQTLALSSSGVLYGWGSNWHGSAGVDPSVDVQPTPRQIPFPTGIGKVVEVGAGLGYSMAMTSTGQVLTWGQHAMLGDGSVADRYLPAVISLPGGALATHISAGSFSAMVVTTAGAVYQWGDVPDAGCGPGTGAHGGSRYPVQPHLPAGFVASAVASGWSQCLVLSTHGTVMGWGTDVDGELGDGRHGNVVAYSPVQVAIPHHEVVTSIYATLGNSAAVTQSGQLLWWGMTLTHVLHTTPVVFRLPAGVKVSSVDLNFEQILIRTTTNQLYAWGFDNREFGSGGYYIKTPIVFALPTGTISAFALGTWSTYVVLR